MRLAPSVMILYIPEKEYKIEHKNNAINIPITFYLDQKKHAATNELNDKRNQETAKTLFLNLEHGTFVL